MARSACSASRISCNKCTARQQGILSRNSDIGLSCCSSAVHSGWRQRGKAWVRRPKGIRKAEGPTCWKTSTLSLFEPLGAEMKTRSPRSGNAAGFDFEKLVQGKLLEKASPSRFLPYHGHEGVYYFLGFYFRLTRKQARELLVAMHNRKLIRVGNRGIEVLT